MINPFAYPDLLHLLLLFRSTIVSLSSHYSAPQGKL
ncbi:hypothetical protein BACOVA_01982 [Bacteroides ovatus ATCC 8483]|uniref:Uncharacterized protein n=1 Tax=Bacteroides ovatus (strain ATCC 8483 / DSM 1896 / JCM 5824 / BCRC 10623 / CCUG 4943 / NCTC 11153) TaxID=411476 RepID=A0AAN3DA94_BACO1|nr:hypothetical protein BACOVA_01982 [Bacteroides ovatus ATCC 8483]